jgi:hypothetical protein
MTFQKLIFSSLLLASFSTAFAGGFTTSKTMEVNFSETDINPKDVKVTFQYWCSYKKKFLDIIEGRIGERTVSCGDAKFDLKIVDNKLVIPGVEKFNTSKGDDLNRYGMQIKLDYQGRNLIWISSLQSERIQNFYKRDFNLTFKKFELNDLEVSYKGLNLVNAPEFNGAATEVTTYFYVKGGKDFDIIDTDFTRSFKWYLTPYSHINKDDLSKLGKISLKPVYHAFINNEVQELNVEVYSKNKDDKFVVAPKIEIPFTQEALDNLKEVELTEVK